MKPTKKMLENAHKVTFLIQQYPEHTLEQIISILQLPAIDINSAIWCAVNEGFIEEPGSAGELALKTVPKKWNFGNTVDELRDAIAYSFAELATKEKDLEENYLGNWTLGYNSHDVLIAMKQLLNDKVLAEYQLTDPEDLKSTYTFYTLWENSEQMWGRKSFKNAPVGDEVAEDPNTPEVDSDA